MAEMLTGVICVLGAMTSVQRPSDAYYVMMDILGDNYYPVVHDDEPVVVWNVTGADHRVTQWDIRIKDEGWVIEKIKQMRAMVNVQEIGRYRNGRENKERGL